MGLSDTNLGESTISYGADPDAREILVPAAFIQVLKMILMRIFGGERVKMIMERVGMEDGVPIEHKYTSKAIENAQKKVEAHNFDIRKHLLEIDDVMNKQREVVYSQHHFVLGGENLKDTAQDMMADVVEDIVDRYARTKRILIIGILQPLQTHCGGVRYSLQFQSGTAGAAE